MAFREIGRWPVRCLAIVVCVSAAPLDASAHHTHQVFYDWCRSVSFEGRITRGEWKAPPSLIDVQTDDGTTYAGVRSLTEPILKSSSLFVPSSSARG